jgi:two-component system OmpR family response regulator
MIQSILVVDDDEVLGQVLNRVLTSQGHETFLAATVTEALELVREKRPTVALLDLCLPDGDGIQLGRDLRALYPGLRLILMTAYPLRLQEDQERTGVFAQVLTKPLNLQELRRSLAATLQPNSCAAAC